MLYKKKKIADPNFHGPRPNREKRKNYAPEKFGALWYTARVCKEESKER